MEIRYTEEELKKVVKSLKFTNSNLIKSKYCKHYL